MSKYYVVTGDNPKNFRLLYYCCLLEELVTKHTNFAVFTNPEDAARYMNIYKLEAEIAAIRNQSYNDNLRADLCDQYEQWLLDIGKTFGCSHLDERLPRCAEEFANKFVERN